VTNLEDLPIRNDLKGLKPYGAPQLDVPVQLNVNENTFGIPEAVAIDIIQELATEVIKLNRYPDREFLELRGAFASYLGQGLRAEQVWAANGSNEIITQIFQAFGGPGKTALSFGPTYSMYPNIARITLTEYQELPRLEDFQLTAEYVANKLAELKPSIVLLCNPNNPTGTPIDNSVISAAYDAFDGILVVDEAYAEFSSQDSAMQLLSGRPRLIVSRTMSKAFAFAGARVGYLAADEAIVDALRIVRLPYHLSALTQAAARAALRHSDLMLANVEQIKVQRDRMIAQLETMGLRAFASDANFVLVEGFKDPHQIFEALLAKGIIVRNVGIPNTLRITAGTESETTRLLGELALILG
jgi:histidinol-phosphate aminotransferase